MSIQTEHAIDLRIEKELASWVIDGLLKAGYLVSIASECTNSNNPSDHEIWKSTDKAAIIKAMFAADEDWIKVYDHEGKDPNPDDPRPFGWVRMIWGNGVDCISDYTTGRVEKAIARANKLAEVIDCDPSVMFEARAKRMAKVDAVLAEV